MRVIASVQPRSRPARIPGPRPQTRQARHLRRRVAESLAAQGFSLGADGLPVVLEKPDKDRIRDLHAVACATAIERSRGGLHRHEDRLVGHFANGTEVKPKAIRPRLHEIAADSEEELLFRYARLQWSIPVSAGYGRRLRFLIFDEATGKLMGLIGLGDPVFAIRPRDEWIGWRHATKRQRLRHVMDAFLIGAVPPYNSLLCGKFIAMLLASTDVRDAFKRKYRGGESLITDRKFDGRLALVTTTSALGRSSIYNRLRIDGELLLESVGFTAGSGEFHFANGLYAELIAYAREHLEPTAKHGRWGNGWRNRREVVRRSLLHLGLPPEMVYHGVERELFVAPLATNTRSFLRGEHERLRWRTRRVEDLFESFRERWLLPRASRDGSYRDFDRESLRVWT
jgi:hypothetical protein